MKPRYHSKVIGGLPASGTATAAVQKPLRAAPPSSQPVPWILWRLASIHWVPTNSRMGSHSSPARVLLNRYRLNAGPSISTLGGLPVLEQRDHDDDREDPEHDRGGRREVLARGGEGQPEDVVREHDVEHGRSGDDRQRHDETAKRGHRLPGPFSSLVPPEPARPARDACSLVRCHLAV
jgi:hypothetical protein